MDDLQSRLTAALAGRYTIEREIGRGGMSIVFLAYDLNLERRVAIKVLRPELAASLGPDRFLDEIKVAARLKHPYILKLHEAGDPRGLLFYSMPYVEGETLRHRLAREGPLRVLDALRIAQEVAEALDHAHRQNIIHRDIKPENILFEESHALVSDFGIAKAISEAGDRRTVPGLVLGTVDYMSPEQEQGRELDGRTDIYSLGLVLYEMLIGHTPSPESTLDSLTGRRPEVPVEVVRILRCALSRDPANRFKTAADFVNALEPLTHGPGAGINKPRWWLVGAGTVATVGVVVAAIVRWGPGESTTSPSRNPTHIAVFPFEDRSANGELKQVAEGMTDELVQDLSQVEALHVPSLHQIKALQAGGKPIDSVLRKLDVGTYVEGTVNGSSTRPRLDARLVDASSGEILATFQFDRPRGDLLHVRDELVTDLARKLRERLGHQVSVQTTRAEATNVDAWVLQQRAQELSEYARQIGMRGDGVASQRAFDEADSLDARAAKLDEHWAEPVLRRGWIAWARAVVVASAELGTEAGKRRQATRIHDGIRFAELALERKADEPRALELRGFLRFQLWRLVPTQEGGDSLLNAAEQDLRRAVRGNPGSARAWSTLSQLLRTARGEHLEAEAAARKALEKDAYLEEAQTILVQLFNSTLERGAFTDADQWCAEGESRFPLNPNFLECRITLLGWAGRTRADLGAAERELARLDTIAMLDAGRPYRQMQVAAILARAGRVDSARSLMRSIKHQYPTEPLELPIASVYLLLGERDSALNVLAGLVRAKPTWRQYVANHYWFRALQNDPRFVALTTDTTR